MRIKELREKANLSQKEVAEKLDIKYYNYNKYELGKVDIDTYTLCKIADYYNVSLDYLCGHETKHLIDTSNMSEEVVKLIKIAINLPLPKLYALSGYALRLSQEI